MAPLSRKHRAGYPATRQGQIDWEAAAELMQGEPSDDWPADGYLTPNDRDLPYELQTDNDHD
jgi:hypothetical protein